MSTRLLHATASVRPRSGYTFIEVLIVVGLVAIFAAVVVPAVGSFGVQSLEASARVLAADLELARSLALKHNTHWTVEFEPAANAYELVHTGAGQRPAPRKALAPAENDGRYRIVVDRNSAALQQQRIRLAGAMLQESRQPVDRITFTPLGGTGPDRVEDTVIWLTQGRGPDRRSVRLTISWITGQTWIDPHATLGPPQ